MNLTHFRCSYTVEETGQKETTSCMLDLTPEESGELRYGFTWGKDYTKLRQRLIDLITLGNSFRVVDFEFEKI